MKPILIVQGGQFGSEAKGAAALFLCEKHGIGWAVRTGSVNAGHSVMYRGKKIAYQQLPVAAIHPSTKLVIGPGAYVHPETLIREIGLTDRFAEIVPVNDRLHIDDNCGIHLDEFTTEAREAGRNLKIGATGKGSAEAVIHKIRDRGVGRPLLLREHWDWHKHGVLKQCDTAEMLTDAYHAGESIMLEGTQGTLLDLHTGPYPFTTCRQTIASTWVTEAGLSPALDYEVVLVVRTYPIRVAGNSGPMGQEISWPELARRINKRLATFGRPPLVREEVLSEFDHQLSRVYADPSRFDLTEPELSLKAATAALLCLNNENNAEIMKLFETTTVTKRLRRIAELDVKQLRLTVKKESPAFIFLSFLNYKFAELVHERTLHREALEYIYNLEVQLHCLIRYVSIGPASEDVLEVPH